MTMRHASDCAVHNMPAYPNGPCDCGAIERRLVEIEHWLEDNRAHEGHCRELIEIVRHLRDSQP